MTLIKVSVYVLRVFLGSQMSDDVTQQKYFSKKETFLFLAILAVKKLKMIFNGNQLANSILQTLRITSKIRPKLGICLVGDSPASKSYVNRKLKACQEINVDAEVFNFQENVQQEQLIKHIQQMHHDGILVQLPLPQHLNKLDIIHSIPFEKDVDCLHMHNLQRILVYGELLPCTPAAVLQILDYYDVNVIGKRVTIIGRSFLVGLPLSLLLQKRNATVTVCHRETLNLEDHIMNADIVISAAGHPKLVRNVKQGAIVIDVGISQGEKKGKIVGDVDFDVVKNQASIITPVPGGVGPMTVCMLMRNLCNIWKKKQGQPVYINPKLSDAYLND